MASKKPEGPEPLENLSVRITGTAMRGLREISFRRKLDRVQNKPVSIQALVQAAVDAFLEGEKP